MKRMMVLSFVVVLVMAVNSFAGDFVQSGRVGVVTEDTFFLEGMENESYNIFSLEEYNYTQQTRYFWNNVPVSKGQLLAVLEEMFGACVTVGVEAYFSERWVVSKVRVAEWSCLK